MRRTIWDGLRNLWHRLQPRTLRSRMLILIVVVNLAILVLTTAGVDLFVTRAEGNAWRGRQSEAARSAAQTVASFLQLNQEDLAWIGRLRPDDLTEQSGILRLLLDQHPALLEIIVLDPNGQVRSDAARDQALLVDLPGLPQAGWFLAARGGQALYTGVQQPASADPYLVYAMPGPSGGVVAARLSLDVLGQVVADIHFGRGGRVFVVNQEGQVIAHADAGIVLANTSLASSPAYQAMQQAPNHEWYGERTNFTGQRVVSASYLVAQTGWTVVTELPVSEAYAARGVFRVLVPAGMILILITTTLFLRFVLSRIFLQSVDILRDGAARFGDGDLSYRMSVPRMDEPGKFVSVFNEMAARLQAQRLSLEQRTAQLRESEQRYRLIAEHAMDVIWLRDMNLKLIYISPSEMRLRGYTPEEALQQDIHQTLTPPSVAKIVDLFADISAQAATLPADHWINESRTLELEVNRKDGSTVWTETRMVFLPDEAGKPSLILGVTRDISKRHRIEQELRALNEKLEERVHMRTTELRQSNTSLLQEIEERKRAEKLLQALVDEKDVLLKEIYHRVKNNLQIISSILNLQSRSVTDPRTLEVLNDSQNRVRSMALIHEKLYQSENLAQVNFRDYLNSLVPSLLRSYHHSGGAITLELAVEDIPLPLEIAIPCGLIVNELVTNILKYAFPDEMDGTLRIELQRSELPRTELPRTADQRIVLQVADDGIGLPAGLDIHHTQSLGLQLVNSLVDQLEGSLECKNQKGTTFVITFRID